MAILSEEIEAALLSEEYRLFESSAAASFGGSTAGKAARKAFIRSAVALHPDKLGQLTLAARAKAIKQANSLLRSGQMTATAAQFLTKTIEAAGGAATKARVATYGAAGAARGLGTQTAKTAATQTAKTAASTGAKAITNQGAKTTAMALVKKSPKVAKLGVKATTSAVVAANAALAAPAAQATIQTALVTQGPVAAKAATKGILRTVLGPIGIAWLAADLVALGLEYLPAVSWWAGGVSSGSTSSVNPSYSGYSASNWLHWPLEVQCAFCRKNGRKPKLSNGKLAPGPSCADMLAAGNLCPDTTQPPPPKRGSLCSRNARLWKSIPDLGPNKKAATKTLQGYLKSAGYEKQMPRTFSDGKADGTCGKETITAVKAFQRDNGLKADGLYGKDSHAKMVEILTALSKKPAAALPGEGTGMKAAQKAQQVAKKAKLRVKKPAPTPTASSGPDFSYGSHHPKGSPQNP